MSQQSSLLFWLLCIPSRLYLAKYAEKGRHKNYLRAAAVLPATVWLSGVLPADTNAAGQDVWWDDLRPFHGALWGLYAATGRYESLVADVFLAIFSQIFIKPTRKPRPSSSDDDYDVLRPKA